MNEKHIEFFNELKELLKKHGVTITFTHEQLMFNFNGVVYRNYGKFYQCASPLFASNLSDSFESIELVTTERVFK